MLPAPGPSVAPLSGEHQEVPMGNGSMKRGEHPSHEDLGPIWQQENP